jgi:hypothetical protein
MTGASCRVPDNAVFADNVAGWMGTATVPVPAAVWLFGYGLGFLGWMRRKQTV